MQHQTFLIFSDAKTHLARLAKSLASQSSKSNLNLMSVTSVTLVKWLFLIDCLFGIVY